MRQLNNMELPKIKVKDHKMTFYTFFDTTSPNEYCDVYEIVRDIYLLCIDGDQRKTVFIILDSNIPNTFLPKFNKSKEIMDMINFEYFKNSKVVFVKKAYFPLITHDLRIGFRNSHNNIIYKNTTLV